MDWQPFTEPGTQARPWPAGRFVSPRRAAALAWVSLRAMIASQIRAAIPAVANALSANGVPPPVRSQTRGHWQRGLNRRGSGPLKARSELHPTGERGPQARWARQDRRETLRAKKNA